MIPTVRTSLLAAFVLLLPAPALAQGTRGHGSQGWGAGGAYARLYDPTKVEKVSGQVVDILKVTPMHGMSSGVEIVVKTASDKVTIHLGPSWFLENQDLRILKGDEVAVEGSRIMLDGKPVVLAASVRKGDELLTLRDASGVPSWAGWRRAR
jgi:hypothetical protein